MISVPYCRQTSESASTGSGNRNRLLPRTIILGLAFSIRYIVFYLINMISVFGQGDIDNIFSEFPKRPLRLCSYKFDRLVMITNSEVKCSFCQGGVKKLMSRFSVESIEQM